MNHFVGEYEVEQKMNRRIIQEFREKQRRKIMNRKEKDKNKDEKERNHYIEEKDEIREEGRRERKRTRL